MARARPSPPLPTLALGLALALAGAACRTGRLVGAAAPPERGAPGTPATAPAAPHDRADLSPERYNLDGINAYRARAGLAPVALDPRLSAFALEGSRALLREGRAHGNFRRAARSGALFRVHGFSGHACENQGDPRGWPPAADVRTQIDQVLVAMMREGPGGGHHDNLLHPRVRRVGIGLLTTPDGRLYLTNDFSE